MTLKNCRVCGKVFVDTVHDVCPVCRDEEEQNYKKVYDYLTIARDAGIDEIHEATGVDRQQIFKFVRQGRFSMMLKNGFSLYVECKSCGKPIQEGQYCLECSNRLLTDIREESKLRKPLKVRQRSKMHTAGRLKDRKRSS